MADKPQVPKISGTIANWTRNMKAKINALRQSDADPGVIKLLEDRYRQLVDAYSMQYDAEQADDQEYREAKKRKSMRST